MFWLSSEPTGAVKVGEILEAHLSSRWSLTIKPSSKHILAPKGSSTVEAISTPWEAVSELKILGYWISNTGSIGIAWDKLRASIWKSYFRLARSLSWHSLGLHRKCTLISKCIAPLVQRASALWPPQHTIGCEMSTLQRKIYACAANLTGLPTDDAASYRRRIGKEMSKLGEKYGWWSYKWLETALSWEAHIQRDWAKQLPHWNGEDVGLGQCATSWSWAPILRNWHDSSWLQQHVVITVRSVLFNTLTRATGLRAQRGFVARRWEEGLDYARRTTLQESRK